MGLFQSITCADILISTQRSVAPQPQSVNARAEVKIAEKEVQVVISEIVEEGQVHSEKAAILESPLLAIQPVSTSPEVITVVTEEVAVEIPKVLDIPEEAVTLVTTSEIPERTEDSVPSAPTSSVSLPPNVEAPTPVSQIAPIKAQITEPVAPNPIPERVECIPNKTRHVSFATPPTPPVSPPRESFAIPAGLRLPPVPVPSSILTPPLSPQMPPIDYFVGIEEEVLEKDKEQDEIKGFKIDDDWEDCIHESVKVEADNSSDHSLDAEEPPQKVKTEEEKQLRDQIREAFEDDMPVVTHLEGTAEKAEETMENSMVIILPEATAEKSEAAEESRPSPLHPPQLSPCTEDNEPTTISLAQEKPALIILTPETEESRVIFDASNSHLSSLDTCAPITPEALQEKAIEERAPEAVATPVLTESAVPTIPSPAKDTNIVFTDPFSLEGGAEEGTEHIDTIVQPIYDIIVPSPTTQFLEEQPEAIRESDSKTNDELMNEITEILHKDDTEVEAVPKAESTQEVTLEAVEESTPEATQNIISGAAEKINPQTAPQGVPEVASLDTALEPPSKAIEVVEPVKEEGVDTLLTQSKVLPTLLVTTPMIPEDEELVIPERKAEDVARPRSSGSKFPSRPSTAKSSGSEAGGSSSSIDFNGTSSSLQRSASSPVVRTTNSSGGPTLFSSETNANAPATPAAAQSVDHQEVLPEGKEVKRLTRINEELEDWVDVATEVARDLKTYVLIEEKANHFTSEDQYARETREQHANERKAQEKPKISQKAAENHPDIQAIEPTGSTPKRPLPTPLQIQTPPKVYNPIPETDYFRAIPRMPSLTHKSESRRVHFDIDDMVAPDSPMFILPIPQPTCGDRPGSRDSAFPRPRSRDSAFSSLSNLDRSLDSINFSVMPKFPPLAIAPRMEPAMVIRDTMSVRSGTSEIGDETRLRPSGEVMKYYNSGSLDWSPIDLERGTFHGANNFAKDRDITEWVNITREEVKLAAGLQQNQDKGPLLPLHHSGMGSEGRGPPRRRWTLLRALSIPFSAFRLSVDSSRSPSTPNSATYPRTPEPSACTTSPRETSGFLPQSPPQFPLTPASPNYSIFMSPVSPLSPVDPIEPIIPNQQNQPLPIRFLKKFSPKGLISGASGAAKKAWGLVRYFTTPTATHSPIPAASAVVERKQSIHWLRGLDEMESGGVTMETAGSGIKEGVLIDFEDEERRCRAREAGKRAAMVGVEELREVVVIPIPTS